MKSYVNYAKSPTTNICFECSFYLCDSCFEFIHNKDENIFHKKEIINTVIPIDLKCHKHPKVSMNIFSLEEKSKLNILFYNLFYYRALLSIMQLSIRKCKSIKFFIS